MMGDSVAPPPPPRSPSPVRRAIAAGERGLVPVHGFSYAAPGGDYCGLHIVHLGGCRNDCSDFDDEVRHIVSGPDLHTFDAVEKVCFGILAACGCESLAVASAGCHVDRTVSLGFYARFHTPEGSSQSFAPSGSCVVSSDFHSTMASDPMVPSASWPSIDEDRSQHPMYVPSVVEVDDSQRRLPSPVEGLSSGERKLYANFRLDRSSDEDYAPHACGIRPEDRITQVSSPPPFVPSFLRRGAGSGFAMDSTIPSGRRAIVPVSKRQHEFISHTKERRNNTPPKEARAPPPLLTTSQVVPSLAVIVRDTPMDLGGGSNTDGTGIGDSMYATNAQPRSVTCSVSPSYSSLPALPLTVSYRSPSQVDKALLSSLEGIRCGNAVPLSSSPSSSNASVTSSSELDDASMVDGCRTYVQVRGKEVYDSLEEVAADMQRLSKQQNNCLDEIVSVKGEIKLLKAVIARLEGDMVAHKAELTVGRGEPVWSSRETIRESVRAEAAKRMNGDVTPSPPPPTDVGVASSFGGKKVAFNEIPDAGFVEVRRKGYRGCKANRGRKDRVAAPFAAAIPVPVPVAIAVSSPPTGAAMYSHVAAAPPPPPVPYTTRPGRQVRARLVTPPSPAVVIPGPSRERVSTSCPSPNARQHHITMRFDAGKLTQLPVTPEAIRIRMNQTLSNLGKVSDKTPYIREARCKLETGYIYLTLAEYTATQVWDRLERCRSTLIRELRSSGLTNFVYHKDVAKVKILVSGVPLAPTGRGSLWKPEDWTGDRAFDGLRRDSEGSNPGVITAGRPNMLGSVFSMKQAGATSCGIRFTLERNDACDKVLSCGRVFLFGKSRNARFFEEHRSAPVCNKCLQVGHVEMLCAFPPRCRFCFGDHLSKSHRCGQLNCPGKDGQSCSHSVRRCMLCERSDHFTGYNRCPVVVAFGSSPAPAGARCPIVADDRSVTGVSDQSRNRQRRRRHGFNVANTAEVMVEKEVSAKGLADDVVEGMRYADIRADHRRGMTDSALPKAKVIRPKIDRKGKGKAVHAYEQAGPSCITEIVEPASSSRVNRASGSSSSTGSSATPPPISTVDDDEAMGFTLGLMAPPKRILKRRASDSNIASPAIQA